MRSMSDDLRLAVRRLIGAPVFSLFSILTLAIGIGATTAIYSAIHALMAPPTGIADVKSLVNITHTQAGSIPMIALSYGDFQDLRARQTVFQGVAGWSILRPSYSASGVAESAFGEVVSGDYFQVLGVVAERGRTIQAADDVAGAPPVVVISHGVWQRVFGGAPDVVGRVLKVNGTAFEVVGVAPREFRGVFNSGKMSSAMWIPMTAAEAAAGSGDTVSRRDDRDHRWVMVKARLKPGVEIAQARAEVAGIASQLDKSTPIGGDLDPRFRSPSSVSRPWVVRRTVDVAVNEGASDLFTPVAATFMLAVGLVLMVACTNLANLALARGSLRRSEMAVRLALGASRSRLVRGLVAECGVIALAGGVLGVIFARCLFLLVADDIQVGNGAVFHLGIQLDPAVLMVSASATLLALVVAGVMPALQNTRGDLRSALQSGSLQSVPRWRGRRILISGQVMVSVLLVSVAALCVAQLRAAARLDTGIDLEHLAIAEVDFAVQRYEPERAKQLVGAVLTQLASRPGVVATAASSGLPIGITTPGASLGTGAKLNAFGELMAGTPGIFRTLGVAITRGRAFDERDGKGSEPVAVVSEATAKALFDRVDVIGESLALRRRQWVGEPEHERKTLRIVGVAADVRSATGGGPGESVVYVPLDQQYEGKLVLLVRADGDPEPFVRALRQELSSVDRDAAVAQAGTGLAVAGPAAGFVVITGSVAGLLGVFALTLALVGLYGVLSHVVARRTREIGVRIALGADRRAIVRLVMREGIRPVLSGLVAGLLIGGVARMAIRPIFARMLPTFDPFVTVLVPLLMLLAALVAIYLPARRAAVVDPNTALRDA